MKLYDRPNKLPIHDIKDYTQKWLAENGCMDMLFEEADKNEIAYVIHRLRRSKRDEEMGDDEVYIYPPEKDLNKNQIDFLKEMAEELDLLYDYIGGYHCLSPKLDLGKMFEN